MKKVLYFDRTKNQIVDERAPKDIILCGGGLSVCYTLISDDVTVGDKPANTPYSDRKDSLKICDNGLIGALTRSTLTAENTFGGGISFTLSADGENLSEYGINLPFDFMGKKNGGGWENQFLFNSPYYDGEKNILYFYLTKPNGANLLIAAKGKVAGWKMDYSSEAYGHFFSEVKILKNFDKAYGRGINGYRLEFAVFPVNDFSDCLDILSKYYDIPFLHSLTNGGLVGNETNLLLYGKADGLLIKNGDKIKKINYTDKYILESDGETEILPVSGNKIGAGITVYGISDVVDLYKRSMDSVDIGVIERTDGNLCEHQCWMSAMLRFLSRFSDRLTDNEISLYENKLKRQLDIITETDESKAIARLTVLNKPYKDYPAYHIFKSVRLQEQFFGVTIFLDAYKYFKDEKYYVYAVNAMECLIDNYQSKDGGLKRPSHAGYCDYTTVCCPMIPLVDMAKFLVGKDDEKAAKFLSAAERMAEYVYDRGDSFPTETVATDNYETEMEEGSISCSALLLLYFCKNVRREDRYIRKAKEFLDLHEPWVIRSSVCQMKNSTLRWWETLWEGDADGPSICAAHAWTIWRAEADFLYYELTGDKDHLIKANNGFTCNLSKINAAGDSYSNYIPDLITGGGFASRSEDVAFKIADDYPKRVDCGLSRYVFIRLNDTFLGEIK